MLWSGSPGWSIYRTFVYQFYHQTSFKKTCYPKRNYRNPIYLAKKYKNLLDSVEAVNQAELARMKSISRARGAIIGLLKTLIINP